MSKRAEQEAKEIHYLALIEANRIAREQWEKGYEQAEKDTIERAAAWLKDYVKYFELYDEKGVEEFKKAMEEE